MRALKLFAFFYLMLGLATSALAAHIVIDAGTGGGDCVNVGTWHAGTNTCTLTADLSNAIEIVSTDTTLDCDGYSMTGPAPADVYGRAAVVLLSGSDGATIRNCNVSNFRNGLVALYSGNHLVQDNNFHQMDGYAIYGYFSFNNIIEGNQVSESAKTFGQSIRLRFDNNSTIRDNNVSDNFWAGLFAMDSHHMVIERNVFSRNVVSGIGLWQVDDSAITDNDVTDHFGTSDAEGISMGASTRNVLSGNRMEGNRFNFSLGALYLEHYDHDIDTSNTVDGKKIYYLKNLSDTVIEPPDYDDAGSIYCLHCSNITIKDLHFDSHSGEAIVLVDTHDSEVSGNSVTEYGTGISTLVSDRNIVRKNDFYVTGPWGMGMNFSPMAPFLHTGGNDNVVEKNTVRAPLSTISAVRVNGDGFIIRKNRILSGSSLEVYSDNSVIEGNLVKNAGGIRVLNSDNVLVRNNTVSDGTPNNGAPEYPDRHVWDENGVQVYDSNNVQITGNLVTGMLDDGLEISSSTLVTVTLNDVYGNALVGTNAHGDDVYQISSDTAIELSDGTAGNYWGRNCGGGEIGRPLFQPGLDSNREDVVDSYPFNRSVYKLVGNPKPLPCE